MRTPTCCAWRTLLVVIALFALVSTAQATNIKFEARYLEEERGPHVARKIQVTGTCLYPDGTRIALGIRQIGETTFLGWFDALVKDRKFTLPMGPFGKAFAAGRYVVEARYAPDRQTLEIKAAVDSQEKRDPVMVEGKVDSGEVIGYQIVQIGTPEQAKAEQEQSKKFFTQMHDELKAMYDAMTAHRADPSGDDTKAGKSWRARTAEMHVKLTALDEKVVAVGKEKAGIPHPKSHRATVEAVFNLQSMIDRESGSGDPSFDTSGGDPATMMERIGASIAAILENLKPQPETDEAMNSK